MRLLILFLLSSTLLINTAHSSTEKKLADAQATLSAGNYKRAFKQYSKLAKKNHPLAMFTLALFHQNGWGKPIEAAKACHWFEKAAHGNIVAAQHFFADCLVNGTHTTANPKAAIAWYLKAAEAGHLISLCSVGRLYIQGLGVDKDPGKGLHYCQRAAHSNITSAQIQMGLLLLSDDNNVGNVDQAIAWFHKAADKNSAEAYFRLGQTILNHQQNNKDALYWFEKAASENYTLAYYPTAQLYFQTPPRTDTGKPDAKVLAKTYLWLSAAKQRDEDPKHQQDIDLMLTQTIKIMPSTWAKELDQKVKAHLNK